MKQNDKPDQSFNTIANKFETNIYGSTKGKLRHELLWHHLNKVVDIRSRELKVLDAGGGTGVMTQPLLDAGHSVTLNDISEDVLTLAAEKMPGENKLTIHHGEIQSLPSNTEYELIVCHAVLEWLKAPLHAIDGLVSHLSPGGYLSLSFFNKDAHRFGNLLYGNFDYVKAEMKNKNTVRLNPNNALEPKAVLHHLEQMDVEIVHKAGIRCFHDYLKNPDMQTSHYESLKEMEIRYSEQEPYLWLGKYFHIIVRKPPLDQRD